MTMDPVTSTAFEGLALELLPALQQRLAALAALPADGRRCDEVTRQLIVSAVDLLSMLRPWVEGRAGQEHVSVPRELVDSLVEHADLLEIDQLHLHALARGFTAAAQKDPVGGQIANVSKRIAQDVTGIRRIAAGLQQRPSSDLAGALRRLVLANASKGTSRYSILTRFEAFGMDQTQVEVAADAFAGAVRCVAEGAIAQGDNCPAVEVSARLSAGLVRATLRCQGLKSLDGLNIEALARAFAAVKGTVFLIRGDRPAIVCEIPASLRVMPGIVVRAGDENYALPVHGIVETMRIDPGHIQTISGQEFLNLRSMSLPLIPLVAVVGKPVMKSLEAVRYAVVVASGSNRFGLVVDSLVEHRNLSLRPLGGSLASRPEVIGGALDTDGNVIMVIDPRHIRVSAAKPSAA